MNLANLKLKFNNLFNNSLVKDTFWIMLAKVFRVLMQALYFVIVARALGAENYGSFIGVTSLASILFPFIALGCEHVLVKHVARDKSLFSTYWGNSLLVLFTNGFLLTFILLILSPHIFTAHISWTTVLMILIADLICLSLLDNCFKALISVNFVQKSAQLGILGSCGKLIAALCLAVFFSQPTIEIWASLYLVSSINMAVVGVLLVNRLVGLPRPLLSKLSSEIKQGIYFSISASASNINASLDKTMLASMGTLTATGIYGSAYRFIDVGYVVLLSLFTASYTRFFQHGVEGIRGCLSFAKRLFPFLAGYGVVSWVGYLILAPFIPLLLGEEYAEAIAALRWLAPLTFIAALQSLAADSLTGAGYQKSRSIIQVLAAIINVGLNIWLIPLYSWKGAACATLISDFLRMMSLWAIVIFLYRRESVKDKGFTQNQS